MRVRTMIPVGKRRKMIKVKPFTREAFTALYRRIDQPTQEDVRLGYTATTRRAAMDRMLTLKEENPAYLGNLITQSQGAGFGYVVSVLAAEARDYPDTGK